MRNVLCSLFATLVIGIWAVHPAAAGDIFTVDNIAVDGTGETAAQARDAALAVGRSQAVRKLYERLTPEEYWPSLPQMTGQEALYIERGFQVANEKSSATRYIANVSFSFQEDRIKQELRSRNIPYTESQARSAVVLPVLRTGSGVLLWEEGNYWADAWRSRSFNNTLVPLVTALGEIDDIANVTAANASTAGWQTLSPLATRYGVGDVMVAEAVAQGSQSLSVTMRRVSSTGASSDPVSITVQNIDGSSPSQLANAAIDQAYAVLETRWKSQTIISPNAPAQYLSATLRFNDIREWAVIRQRLADLNMVRNLAVRAISPTGAELGLTYSGSVDQLRVALAQKELLLVNSEQLTVIELAKPLAELEIPVDEQMDGEGQLDAEPLIEGAEEIISDPEAAATPMETEGSETQIYGAENDL